MDKLHLIEKPQFFRFLPASAFRFNDTQTSKVCLV